MTIKKAVKAFRHLLTFLLFVGLFMLLFAVVTMKASGGEASVFGYQIKTVLSGSMEPGIQTGSIIAIKETDEQHSFAKGDVITFLTESDMVVTHRIDEVITNGHSYTTKGDANDGPDLEPVMQENIIGMYKGFTVPYVGYVLNVINTGAGLPLLLVVPGIGLIIYSIIQISSVMRAIGPEKRSVSN